jgi:ketosteroid isomerase-like protein
MNRPSIHPSTQTSFVDQLEVAFLRDDAHASVKRTEAGNLNRIHDQYRCIVQGDFSRVFADLADDAEYQLLGLPDLPLIRQAQGRQQIADAVRHNFSLLEDQQLELLDIVAQGDLLAIFARERGRFRSTGKAYDMHWVQLFDFKDGKVRRFRGLASPSVV